MFQDLDSTLAALLRAELSLSGVDISFDQPDESFPPTGVRLPAVSFFLYDIREQTDVRVGDRDLDRGPDGLVTRRKPPARVACSYLITAWPSDSAPAASEDEHRLLGEVLKVLLRHPKIPAQHLRGELVGQELPMPTRIMAENRLHSLGEFWQAMGGKPKAALHYGITVALDVFPPVPAGPNVDRLGVTVTTTPAS